MDTRSPHNDPRRVESDINIFRLWRKNQQREAAFLTKGIREVQSAPYLDFLKKIWKLSQFGLAVIASDND